MLSFVDMDGTTNALAPIEFIVSVAGGVMLFLLGLSAAFIAFGSSDGTFLTVGDPEVCLVTSSSAVDITAQSVNGAHVGGLAPGVRSYPEQVNICQADPSAWQHLWSFFSVAPEFLYSMGFLFVTWRLIRATRRRGFFVPDTALGIGRLGLYILFGELTVAMTHATASAILLPTLVTPAAGHVEIWLRFFHLSWAILFAGFGLLTIGRVMAQTVPMRAELDATV